MTKGRFDPYPYGRVARDDESADVRGPGAAYCIPSVMRRQFIGETTQKVVRLADIYRIPHAIVGDSTENVDTSERVEHGSDGVMLKFIRFPAHCPDETRGGLD